MAKFAVPPLRKHGYIEVSLSTWLDMGHCYLVHCFIFAAVKVPFGLSAPSTKIS